MAGAKTGNQPASGAIESANGISRKVEEGRWRSAARTGGSPGSLPRERLRSRGVERGKNVLSAALNWRRPGVGCDTGRRADVNNTFGGGLRGRQP
jgi:hypothetical protein